MTVLAGNPSSRQSREREREREGEGEKEKESLSRSYSNFTMQQRKMKLNNPRKNTDSVSSVKPISLLNHYLILLILKINQQA
jgi:hypothetical protein